MALAVGAAVVAGFTGVAAVNGDAVGIVLGIALLANFGWFALVQRNRERSAKPPAARAKRR